ncbi:DUF4097 family beta strand repeat-containing protein [Streptomyces sp. NPDC029003]|uniref:DUF4097 family beta strand repeat-containing protein n=1 Tax=Streptomyces sp. NPDC029003 TaxID=3155125 RepID=UPI0033DBBD49
MRTQRSVSLIGNSESQESTMQKFDSPAPVSLVLDVPAGRVHLIAADRADTEVRVLPADASKSRDVKAAEQTSVEYGDGVLRINAAPPKNQLLGASGAVDVTVLLPAGSRVEARTAAAEFRGEGRLGEVAFEGAQGSVRLEETAGGRLTLLAGDIAVGRLGGSAEISTQKGDISVAEALGGKVLLTTQAGNLTIAAAPGVSASLDAGTTAGRIHNSLTNGAGAGAALTVHATTAYGDITARSL